jgi:hypothetical protein
MKKVKTKKMGLRFLFLLIIMSIVFVFLGRRVNSSEGSIYETATIRAQECVTCSERIEEEVVPEDVEYMIFDAINERFLNEQEVDEILDEAGVLGLSAFCDDPSNTVDLERKTCVDSGLGIHHEEPRRGEALDGVVNTQKINTLKLTKVYYPLAFFLGQYEHINSNKEIAIGKPEYPSSGESIPGGSEYLLKTLTPQQAPVILERSLRTEREPYEVSALLATDDAAEVLEVEDGFYLVENAPWEPEGPCPEEVSTYDFNVGATNFLGANEEGGGFWRYQIPQKDNYNIPTVGDCITDPKADEITDGLWDACVTEEDASYFKGRFLASWSPEKWEECTWDCRMEEYDCDANGQNCKYRKVCSECIQPITITVYLTPIFGHVYQCDLSEYGEDEAPCANAFLTYSYMGTLTPQEADERIEVHSDYEKSLMFLVLTRCEGVLEYENGDLEAELPNLKCLWDATPTLMNYKLQRKDKIPNQRDFPQDFQSHWEEVFEEISNSAAKYGL